MSGPRALVTGASGFVGRALLRQLVAAGWQTHALVRSQIDAGQFDRAVTWHRCAGTSESIGAIVRTASPAVVFHLASLFIAEHRAADVERLLQSNVLFGTQLVEALSEAGAPALVNAGTSWQHFNGHDYSPVNLYAASKQAFEAVLQYYVEARELRVTTLALSDTYGPGDTRPKLMTLLRRVAVQNQPLAMSPGGQLIDLVHVEDVARAFLLAGERLGTGTAAGHECFAVSSGRPVTLRELAQAVEHVLGRSLPLIWGGRPYRAREVMVPWQGQPLAGWQPRITLADGLAQVFADLRSPGS